MKTTLVVSGLLACVLAGCATVERVAGIPRPVGVYVVAMGSDAWVSVDEDPIHRAPGDRSDITFQLRGAGFKFPGKDALTFDDARQAPPPEEIVCSSDGAQMVVCKNRHTTPGTYKYTLHVLRDSGTEVLPALDPFIINH